MPRREPAAFLFDAAQACARVREHVAGVTLELFLTDRKTRDAVERQLSIAGEAVAQLRRVDRAHADRLGPVDQIVGFRNLLVHAYFTLDPREVWNIVVHHVPSLEAAARALLESMPPPDAGA